MNPMINIAGYLFVPLDGLRNRKSLLLNLCRKGGLKGTILLSPEGINLFMAGTADPIEALLQEIRSWPGCESFSVKKSESIGQPFNRLLIRLKKEIIAFGVEGIDPSRRTSPKISARQLKQWLDEGRPVTLLDTRNDYEVKLGTFEKATALGIRKFRDFPNAVRQLPEQLKDQPVVMFCTGGIRCEKAGPLMEREGFKNILQLEGGILKYFEDCGNAHYQGECFVFDQRVGVDPNLQETDSTQCFRCLSPLTPQEQEDPRYQPGKSCPYCFKTTIEVMREQVAKRQERIRQATRPLPGSVPYDNFRPLTVPGECDSFTLGKFLSAILPHTPLSFWEELSRSALLLDGEKQPVSLDRIVHSGERFLHKMPGNVEPPVNPDIEILHEDEALLVINKPAPLPMHPGGRYNRNTLQSILHTVYHPQKPRPAHRLDANTTGVVLVTRTRHFASRLQPQFANGDVRKTYLVRVQGWPDQERFACDVPIGAGASEVGSRDIDLENGLASRTEFEVIKRFLDGTALIQARPVTGRTNQIRLHLWHRGYPVCGDSLYLPGMKKGDIQTLPMEAPPLCLHSWKIEFNHPLDGSRVRFEAPIPRWG